MQLKNIFFIVLSLICTINHQSYCMEEYITFTKDGYYPGDIRDVDTLFELEKMADTAYDNLKAQGENVSYAPFIPLILAKELPQKSVPASQTCISIPQSTLKHFVKLIIEDEGEIREWSFGKVFSGGMDMNVQLLDKNDKSIYIEGPILDAARRAGLVNPNKNLEVQSQTEIHRLLDQERNGECIIN